VKIDGGRDIVGTGIVSSLGIGDIAYDREAHDETILLRTLNDIASAEKDTVSRDMPVDFILLRNVPPYIQMAAFILAVRAIKNISDSSRERWSATVSSALQQVKIIQIRMTRRVSRSRITYTQ